ncbi:MAG: hypothetical protein ACPLY9_01500 [Nitrososphaerales archaeon]
MIDDEKRLRKRDIVNWDFFVEANDPRAFQLLPTMAKVMDVPIQFTVKEESSKEKDECKDCKFKQAVQEILNVLAAHNLVKKSENEKPEQSEGKSYRIKVE